MTLNASRARDLIRKWMGFACISKDTPLTLMPSNGASESKFTVTFQIPYETMLVVVSLIDKFRIYYNKQVTKNPNTPFETILEGFIAEGTVKGGGFLVLDYESQPPNRGNVSLVVSVFGLAQQTMKRV